MPIEGFDYKAFATDLSQQAMAVLKQPNTTAAPDILTEQEKKVIIETVKSFCLMAGEALNNDENIKFNAEQASLVTQFIGEWAFHKSIDLIKGKVPIDYREPILKVIAANIFSTAKLAIIKGMQQDAIINLIEEKVKNVYIDELQKLVKKGVLNQQQFETAVNTSNLNDMVQKTEDQDNLERVQNINERAVNPTDKKVLKFAALAIVLKKLPPEKANEILNSLDKNDAQHVLNYMKMSNIESKIDPQIIIKSIEEIKKILPEPDTVNVEKLLKRHHKVISTAPPDVLSELAMTERDSVKDFILDIRFPAKDIFPPLVIQSLTRSIEEKLNDY